MRCLPSKPYVAGPPLPSQQGALPTPTFCVAGTRYVGTLTSPPALCSSLAAAMKSSVLPPVQEPMYTAGCKEGRMGQKTEHEGTGVCGCHGA